MNRYFLIFVLYIALATGCFAMANKSVQSTPKTFTEIIAEHSTPNLDDLAEQCKPSVIDPNISIASFYDLLKLRSTGTVEAIPVLEQIIQDNLCDTRIHGFAAAQALFCIGTPRAHEVLNQYLSNDCHNTQLGINYTFHWEMPEPQRSALIEQYYLQNHSQTLKIELSTDSEIANDIQTIIITATLKNTSQEPYRIYDYPFAFGDHLYFRIQDGRFIQKLRTSTRCFGRDEWIELKPGQTKQYQIKMEVAIVDQLYKSLYRYLKNGNLWLKEDHSNAFFIGNPGTFQIYAMLENAPFSKERKEQLGFDNVWIGRAVSKSVKIIIDPVK